MSNQLDQLNAMLRWTERDMSNLSPGERATIKRLAENIQDLGAALSPACATSSSST